MHISKIALDHIRSWKQCVLDIQPGITIFQGSNGLGKTNIVEAIEVVATGASHRTSSLQPLIERGQSSGTIRLNVEESARNLSSAEPQTTTYEVTLRSRGANRARINGGPSLYMRKIIGDIPVVAFTPEDQHIITADPSVRRTFLNQTASLLMREYPTVLQQFTHVAKQRAALLKQLSKDDANRDAQLSGLEVWTGQYIELGVALTRMRQQLIDQLNTPFQQLADQLTGTQVHASLRYEPSFEEVLMSAQPAGLISEHFQRLYAGEVARGVNLIGPQRDDMQILLDDIPAREFASNGEQWTLAIALKMAVYQLIMSVREQQPIVILDDVFAQLDENRRNHILQFAQAQEQVLITVAAASDIPQVHDAHIIDVRALREDA